MNQEQPLQEFQEIAHVLGQLAKRLQQAADASTATSASTAAQALELGLDAALQNTQPLPKHHLAIADKRTRQQYATLLCAMLMVAGPLGAAQQRLLGLLLNALNLPGQMADLLAKAYRIQPADVTSFLQLSSQHDCFSECLLADALVLMRLEQPQLHSAQQKIVMEYAAATAMPEHDVRYAAGLSDLVLGYASDLPKSMQDFHLDVTGHFCKKGERIRAGEKSFYASSNGYLLQSMKKNDGDEGFIFFKLSSSSKVWSKEMPRRVKQLRG